MRQRKIFFFKTSLLQLCRDRVLMDSLVLRERLEITVQREIPDPPDLLDPLVPLDLRFVWARTTAPTARCAPSLPWTQQRRLFSF